MRIPIKISFLLLFFLILNCKEDKSNTLTIATASNMQYAMKELTRSFKEQTGTECVIIVGSSGKLTAQIMEKAPYDVFVSADIKYPNELYKKGFAESKPSIYALGKLVLWSTTHKNPNLDSLTNNSIKNIAIANPKTAPYGLAAVEVLKEMKLYGKVEDKLVYGESISQTNQFILSGAADMGFTAKSVVLSPNLKEKGYWVPINISYEPISQGIVLLKNSSLKKESKQFYDFLFSKKAQETLEKYGYSVPVDTKETSK
ncbi:molybdate transport system substrate-binding protein [Saonia flava]|uniref:Molybdate transport system substrate-binding protein n=1 Tax=Saonia flava TaxID=523696 RepID=A0A846QX86_9FLAO|nr:molybdate ABC transporter substrate-binding protein [Saonia flava]NJB72568.1 molybdate transport system substrate-binding protein [Saonia flava]